MRQDSRARAQAERAVDRRLLPLMEGVLFVGTLVVPVAVALAVALAAARPALGQEASLQCVEDATLQLIKQSKWTEARTAISSHLARVLASGPGPSPALRVCVEIGLASVNGQLENYPEAIAMLQRTLAMAVSELGPSHPRTIEAEFHLAALYSKTGEYDKALPVYRELLPKYERQFGPDSLSVATLLRSTSTALHWVGNFRDALPADERALRIFANLKPGPQSCDTALYCRVMTGRAHQYLADTLRRLGRAQEALPHALKGVEMQLEGSGETHPNTIDAQLVHASVLLGLGRIDEARDIQRKAMVMAREHHGAAHGISRKAAGDYAASSRTAQERQEAITIETEKLAILEDKGNLQHPESLLTAVNLAEKHFSANQFAEGLTVAEAAVRRMAARTDTLAFDDRTQEAWAKAQERLNNIYILLLLVNKRTHDAFIYCEYIKHRKLSLALDGQAVSSDNPELLQQIKRASRRLALLDQRIALARSLQQPQDALASARAKEFQAWQAIAQAAPPAVPSVADAPRWLRRLVAQQETFVSYRFAGNLLVGFVLTPQRVVSINLKGGSGVRTSVEAYRLAMRHAAMGGRNPAPAPLWRMPDGSYRFAPGAAPAGATPVHDPGEILQSLSGILLAQVLPHVGPQKRLVVSIDENLGHVPFDALPLPGGALLGERLTVSMLPSFALYETLVSRQALYAQLPRQPLLAIGGAHYSKYEQVSANITMRRERPAPLSAMEEKILWQAVQRDRTRLPLAFAQLARGPADLPGSKVEVENIARSFDEAAAGGPRAVVLTGEGASEDAINQLAGSGKLERFRVLHFSTHGYLSDDEPALSAIVLSQVNRAAGTDGFLTAAELSTMSFQSDLVVVSACDSGASGGSVPGQGAAGLSYSLFQAGTVASLLTLWPVEDVDSGKFMERFYADVLKGSTAADALQKTKAWARRNGISAHVVQGFVMWGI